MDDSAKELTNGDKGLVVIEQEMKVETEGEGEGRGKSGGEKIQEQEQDTAMLDVNDVSAMGNSTPISQAIESSPSSGPTTTTTIASATSTTVPSESTPSEQPQQPPLSKNAIKRLRKEQQWLERKAERKAHQKQKKKEAKAWKREMRIAAVKQQHEQRQQYGDEDSDDEASREPRKSEQSQVEAQMNIESKFQASSAVLEESSRKRKASSPDTTSEVSAPAVVSSTSPPVLTKTTTPAPSTPTTLTHLPKIPKPASIHHPITFIIDCGFDDLMHPKEIISLSSQVTRCYSDVRTSSHTINLHITSLNKRLLTRFQTILGNSHKKWKRVKFSEEEYPVVHPPTTIPDMDSNPTPADSVPVHPDSHPLIYLTSDSPYTLTQLEPYKTYIIGGIVDRNRHKGICYQKAVSQRIATAKLPIGEYIKMSSRHVLTTNQVVEIMLRWLQCKDWKEAFLSVIPQRKMPMAKVEGEREGGAKEEGGEG